MTGTWATRARDFVMHVICASAHVSMPVLQYGNVIYYACGSKVRSVLTSAIYKGSM